MGTDESEETARIRIRDAALEQFAEHGERGATIRGIARAAEVSPALVQHYFGTKEGLRQACDEYAIELFRTTKEDAMSGGLAEPGFMEVAFRAGMPVQRYLARALVDGSEAADKFFDDAVALSEELLQRDLPGLAKPNTDDLHGYAAVMTAISFSLVVMHHHLSRALGANTLTREGYPRLVLAALEVHSDVLLSPELLEQARAALRQMAAAQEDPGDDA
ncbi:TetR/AcrR family transcriptional regulator [Actinomadura litoris]|uniref:TetR/AcrR family transcriptional regulator n=1 Tax=Actinomadura litoris TaxID=2678616 RepID=UPI001FA77DF9|nr:TetR family transcriptional regulator [Actinomadura litoris]